MKTHPVVVAVRRSLAPYAPGLQGLVVGVSGGPDSVGLLAALVELQLCSLAVVHVNHQLRGTESDEDAQFVHEMATSFGLPVRVVVRPVPSDRRNLEASARRLRYHAFAETAADLKMEFVATAHTADDQAETVLHRMIRGCGLDGLAGIWPRRRLGGTTLIRPLLDVRRADVLDYLHARQFPFRVDSSNKNLRFTRNRIRAELVPLVESFNPSAVEQLARLATLAFRAQNTNKKRARALLTQCELPRAGRCCVLDRAKLERLSPESLGLLWRQLWRREKWPRDQMGLDKWDRLSEFNLVAADLPGGIRIERLPRVVRIGPGV